jgi:hypothetical protein
MAEENTVDQPPRCRFPIELTHLTALKIISSAESRWWEGSGTLGLMFVRLGYRDRFTPTSLLCIDNSSRFKLCDENSAMCVTGRTIFLK